MSLFDPYTSQLLFWWALFGGAAVIGYAMNNDDDNGNSSGNNGGSPGTDDDLSAFAGQTDFNPDLLRDFQTGDSGDNTLTAQLTTPTGMAGLGGDDSITGSRDSDYILGGDGNDTIVALVGIDTIHSGAGDDLINAGLGTDFVHGGEGDDTIDGLGNNDQLYGEGGDDLLIGQLGPDFLNGGDGNDTLSGLELDRAAARTGNEETNDGLDVLVGGNGDDELWLATSDSGEGGEGADAFILDYRSFSASGGVAADQGPSVITDYSADDDKITALFDASGDNAELPEITQSDSENGEDRLIFADGVQIVTVVGAGGGDDIAVEAVSKSE